MVLSHFNVCVYLCVLKSFTSFYLKFIAQKSLLSGVKSCLKVVYRCGEGKDTCNRYNSYSSVVYRLKATSYQNYQITRPYNLTLDILSLWVSTKKPVREGSLKTPLTVVSYDTRLNLESPTRGIRTSRSQGLQKISHRQTLISLTRVRIL